MEVGGGRNPLVSAIFYHGAGVLLPQAQVGISGSNIAVINCGFFSSLLSGQVAQLVGQSGISLQKFAISAD